MTKQELLNLPIGTILYNGEYEAAVKMDGDIKCLEILVPIYAMSNDKKNSICRQETWDVLE